MKDLDPMAVTGRTMKQIGKGAFLTVKTGEDLNTMTIGWALSGVMWRKPILVVAVRLSRHTFGLIEKAGDFTVTVPAAGLEQALAFCGTRSGRDVNKLEHCGLGLARARYVHTPVLDAPGIHYECRIVYKSAIDPGQLDVAYDQAIYLDKDYHTLYFGEIAACYETP